MAQPEADRVLAQVIAELETTKADTEAILQAATTSLSKIRRGVWIAGVMNPDPATSYIVASAAADPEMATWVSAHISRHSGRMRAPTAGLMRQVIETQSPAVISSRPLEEFIQELSPFPGQSYVAPHPSQPGVISALIVPMRLRGATIGTLSLLEWPNEPTPGEGDLQWIAPVADQLALWVEHARLYASVNDQADRMAMLNTIALATASGLDERLVLRVVLDQVVGRLNINAAAVLLRTQDGDHLAVAATAGFRSPPPPDSQIHLDASLADPRTAGPRVEYASDRDDMKRGRAPLSDREPFETFVTVPLFADNRLLGVLGMYSRLVVEWDENGLDFLTLLSRISARAIEVAMTQPAPAQRRRGASRPELNDFELEMLRMIVEGFTNNEIARQMHRSENTIKFHVRRILDKTGASNRTDLARRATIQGWL